MELLVLLTDDVHVAALRHASKVGTKSDPLSPQLMHAMLDDHEVSSWVGKIWDEVETALGRAYHEGIEAAKPYLEKVSVYLSDLAAKLAKKANEVRKIIAARINDYLQQAIDGALERVRPTISVGGRELQMKTITIDQSVKLSGSLKASLEEVCEFVAEGEISLSAEYGS